MKKNKILTIFLITTLSLFAIFIILLLGKEKETYLNIFYARFKDLMADFFNVCTYIVKKNPYNNEINGFAEKAYLPISYLILYPFAKVGDFKDINPYVLNDAMHRPVNIFLAFIFTLLSILLLIYSINRLAKKWKIDKKYLIPLYLSGIFLYTIERGNLILLSVSLLILFISYYDSENKYLRLFAAFCLALTAALKFYPVVFGLLYLKNKQYKDAIVSALIALAIVFLPFLFFKGGFDNISLLFRNLKLNSERYSGVNMFSGLSIKNFCNFWFYGVVGKSATFTANLSNRLFSICRVSVVLCVLLSIFQKNKFNILAALFFAIILLQDNSRFYCILYIIPVYMYLIKEILESKKILRYVPILIYFVILLNPIAIEMKVGKYNGIINEYLITFLTIVFFIVLFIKVIVEGVSYFKHEKESSKSKSKCNSCAFSI